MAYMRGDYYLWSDTEDHLHIWVADGNDNWGEPGGLARDQDGVPRPGRENASGVCLPQAVMDQYVLMRVAELIYGGQIEETIARFLSPQGQHGNFGGELLEHNADALRAALSSIELSVPGTPSQGA